MPLTYVNSLAASTLPFRRAFHWLDDPAEDQAFLDFAVEELDSAWDDVSLVYRNLTLDRTGAEPTVKWDLWDYGTEYLGPRELVIAPAGSFWAANQSKRNLGVGAMDMNLYWECDARGRALTIDSLVVP